MTQNRKRSRSVQDETEFMPLSKRINNLHINNMLADSQLHNTHMGNHPEWMTHQPQQQHILPESPSGSELSTPEWNCNPQYSPDLTESQNPHYFNINKLLYEMYVERMNRGCHQI